MCHDLKVSEDDQMADTNIQKIERLGRQIGIDKWKTS